MSLASGDLTTLTTAKAYVEPTPSDALLSGMITRVSQSIRVMLNRPLLVPKTYTEQRNGTGTQALVLPNWPLLSLSSLVVEGVDIPVAPQVNDPTPPSVPWGYRFQPWDGLVPGSPAVVELIGFSYLYGNQNVVVTYSAGYKITNEAATIPATTPFTVTPTAPYGSWATDEGVTFSADGTALTAIVSGTPTAGQYLPPAPDAATPRSFYTFASADLSKGVLLSYGFIPGAVEQVALEMIAERASYRRRAGIRSQSLAGQEMISYELGMNSWERRALQEFVSTLPPAMGANV